METPWVWRPILPQLPLLGGAVILMALAVFAYVRAPAPRWARLLLVMRLAVIVGITVLLFGPSRELAAPTNNVRPKLTVLVDASQSMLTDDCSGRSRMRCVAEDVLPPAQRTVLERAGELEFFTFSENAGSLSLERLDAAPDELADGRSTQLADVLQRTLARLNGAQHDAVLLISDGRDSTDAPLAPVGEFAAARTVPVYTVAVGETASAADAALMAIPMQDSLLPNEAGGLLVRVYQSGLDDGQAVVRVRHSDQEQEIPIRFEGRKVVELQAPVKHAEPGQYDYAVSVDGVEGETELANNTQSVFVNVLRRRLRVLVLEGEPYWDTKFLAQSLRKDEQVELLQVTQVGERKRETITTRDSAGAPRAPATLEDWTQFDVVILGRRLERLLDDDAASDLVRFVEQGGAVVFARGRAYDPNAPEAQGVRLALAKLEPATWSMADDRDVTLELAPAGRSSTWLSPSKTPLRAEDAFLRLPGLDVLQLVERLKPATIVLATSRSLETDEQRPAIVRMSLGRGAVAAILGEGVWRWSLLAPPLQDLQGFYDIFWSNLVRWLALGGDFPPGQQTALQLSRVSVRLGDALTADVVYKLAVEGAAPPQLEIIGPDGAPQTAALHRLPGPAPRFRAELQPTAAGVHRVRAVTPGMTPAELDARFNVYDLNLERLQTAANPLALKMLADASGGAALEPAQLGRIAEELERRKAMALSPPRTEYVWDQAVIMYVLLGWTAMEWLLRRRAGLW